MFDTKQPKGVIYSMRAFAGGYPDFLSFVKICKSHKINVIILAFIFFESATKINMEEAVTQWLSFTPQQRQTLKSALGGPITLSHGGFTGSFSIENYAKYGMDHVVKTTWDFIQKNDLDGVDVDYENVDAKDLYTFSVALANAKPANMLYTMAPQASWEELNNHRAVYSAVGDKIDWFNLQIYNQTSEFEQYRYTMIDADDTPVPTSIRGIITGTKIKSNPNCRNQPCKKYEPIPSYKVVIGSCITGETGCQSVTPDMVVSFIQKASQDTNGYFTDWLTNGGMMVWEYLADMPITDPSNSDTLSSISKAMSYFTGTLSSVDSSSPGGNRRVIFLIISAVLFLATLYTLYLIKHSTTRTRKIFTVVSGLLILCFISMIILTLVTHKK